MKKKIIIGIIVFTFLLVMCSPNEEKEVKIINDIPEVNQKEPKEEKKDEKEKPGKGCENFYKFVGDNGVQIVECISMAIYRDNHMVIGYSEDGKKWMCDLDKVNKRKYDVFCNKIGNY